MRTKPANEDEPLEPLWVDDDGGTFTTDAAHSAMRFRVRAARLPDGDSWGVVALSLDEVDAANRSLLVALGLAGSVIVVVLGVVGWWMYRLGLRPISKVTAVADSIAAGDRGQRVEPDRPGTEAARLAARGDDAAAARAAGTVAPDGAVLQLRRDGGYVVATVNSRSALLPGVSISATAAAAAEPGSG